MCLVFMTLRGKDEMTVPSFMWVSKEQNKCKEMQLLAIYMKQLLPIVSPTRYIFIKTNYSPYNSGIKQLSTNETVFRIGLVVPYITSTYDQNFTSL